MAPDQDGERFLVVLVRKPGQQAGVVLSVRGIGGQVTQATDDGAKWVRHDGSPKRIDCGALWYIPDETETVPDFLEQ
jgi:hypothetical protein